MTWAVRSWKKKSSRLPAAATTQRARISSARSAKQATCRSFATRISNAGTILWRRPRSALASDDPEELEQALERRRQRRVLQHGGEEAIPDRIRCEVRQTLDEQAQVELGRERRLVAER